MNGKKVLITGASSGIGLAIAAELVKLDAQVVNLSRSVGKLEKLPSVENATETIACDISDAQSVKAAIERLQQREWTPDVLINNAGIALGAPKVFWDQPLEDIHKVIGVNVFGMVNVTWAVLKHLLIPAGKGTILNISSVTGLEVPIKGMGEVSYHSTKAFVEGFTNSLRNETIGTDIRVLALRPGFVRTNFHFDRVGNDKKKFEDVFEGMQPLTAEDVATAAIWALSQPERVSIKALDIVPTPQRSLTQNDRDWSTRHAK
jgi:3-hydroxy acid dehydrogenase / malonic semialdehyde reductase